MNRILEEVARSVPPEELLDTCTPDVTGGPTPHWLERLKRIDEEVTQMALRRQIWHTFRGIVAASAAHRDQPLFSQWVAENYAHTQALAIRRMVDDTKNVQSFTRLLRDISKGSDRITRQWFLNGVRLGIALVMDGSFTAYTGSPESCTLDRKIPDGDGEELKKAAKPIKAYVDTYIAHAGAKTEAHLPTYDDIDDVIDLLKKLLVKYQHMLERTERIGVEPVIQMPWHRVFQTAWTTPADQEPGLRSKKPPTN